MYSARVTHRLLHIVCKISDQTARKQADKFIDAVVGEPLGLLLEHYTTTMNKPTFWSRGRFHKI